MKISDKRVSSINKDIKKQVQELIIARLNAIPKDIEIAIGSNQYTKEELLKFVKSGNEKGDQLMEMQLQYLRDLASGKIYNLIDE